MLRLAVLSTVVGLSIWFEQSTLAPFATDRAVSYVLCTPSLWHLAWDGVVVAAVLGGACLALEHTLLIDSYSDRARFSSAVLFSPIALVGANLLNVGLLRDEVRDWWPPVAYIGGSLYSFLWIAAIGLSLRNVYAATATTFHAAPTAFWSKLDAARQSLLLDAAIAASIAAIVIATSPKIRFSGTPVGDEPKYLRYAENWWQGRGMNMDGVRDASDIPASKEGPKFLSNFSKLLPAIGRDVSQLASDVSYLGNSKHWGHQFNKATYVGNWFVTGKNGGLYQIHQPGISVVIMPAYAIDRWLFDRSRGRLADDLFAVNLVMLLIFMTLAAVTFRLVDRVIQHRAISAIATVSGLASLPLASFVFQFYPETLGAVLVAAVVLRSLKSDPLTALESALIGIALGWLVWLQVRFAILAGTLFLWTLWASRRQPRAWLTVTVVSGLVVGLFCFYVYHVTGSLLPSALYDATPDPGFRASRLPIGVVGVLFDRENGLFALAPLFLLALPGLGVMLREQRTAAWMILTLFLALLITVAGHGYETSGTSPLRHMVAAVPLAIVPLGAWLRASRGRTMASAIAAALILMSIQMAVAYNLENDKTITQTMAAGVSGWDPSLVFPLLRRTEQPGFDKESLIAWELLAVAAVAAGFWWSSNKRLAPTNRLTTSALGASLAIISLVGIAAIAAGGARRELRLLKTPAQSLRECRDSCATRMQFGTVPTGTGAGG